MSVGDEGATPIFAVVGARDGVGKTALAVNLAAAMTTPTPAVLVDFDVHFGGVEVALQVRPEFRIDDAVRKLSSRSKSNVENFLTNHPVGVSVLCAPLSPIVADQLQPAEVFGVVEKLRSLGRPLIIDTSGGLNEYSLGSVERATHTLLVATTDVASVRATRKLLDTWTQLQIEAANLSLILSHSRGRQSLTRNDIENAIGHPVAAVIPYSDEVASSLDIGVPIVLSDRRSKAAKAFSILAAELLSEIDVETLPPSVLETI